MSRLRNRRHVARLIVKGHATRSAIGRELRWLGRDLRDLRAELRRYRRRAVSRMIDPAPYVRDDELGRDLAALARREDELRRREAAHVR